MSRGGRKMWVLSARKVCAKGNDLRDGKAIFERYRPSKWRANIVFQVFV